MTDSPATAPPAAPLRTPRRHRVWRWLLAVAAVVLVLVGAILWWVAGPGSLPRVLQLAQRFLPEDQQLAWSDTQGSLARGGRIGRLQWSSGGTEVIIEDLRMAWSLHLFRRALDVRTLAAAGVRLRLPPRPEDPDEPAFTMPAELSLPLRVRLPLAVTRLQVDVVDAQDEVATWVIEALAAGYAYDRVAHALRVERLHYGRSSLQASMQLHARELDVTGAVDASLRDLVPDRPFALQARLEVGGTLAGGDAARLDLSADATELASGATPPDALTALRARATVHPWREQPVQQLDLEVSGFDAHAFHDAAPVTGIAGRASVQPVGGAQWDLLLDFTNGESGPWERQRIPLRTLSARARLAPEQLRLQEAEATMTGAAGSAGSVSLSGQIPLQQPAQSTLTLTLQQLDLQPWMEGLPRTVLDGEASVAPAPPAGSWSIRADIRNAGPGPLDQDRLPLDRLLAQVHMTPERWRAENLEVLVGDGRLQLQGHYDPGARSLDVQGELRRVPLRRIHAQLASSAAAVLSGTLGARGNFEQGVAFDADISSSAADAAGAPSPWEIRTFQARGSWSPSSLTVDRLHVDAFEARIDGSGIQVALPQLDGVRAQVSAVAPGLSLQADAAMRQQSGGGRLSLEFLSASEVLEWLRGLPLVGERVPALEARGSARLQAEWQGGWRQWMDGLKHPAAHPQLHADVYLQARDLRASLAATAPEQSPTTIDVDHLDVALQGNLAAADLVVDGGVQANAVGAQLDVRMQMTQRPGGTGDPQWTLALGRLAAAVTLPDDTDPWRLEVAEGLQLTFHAGAEPGLDTSEGRITLAPPRSISPEGKALEVAWQPLQWSRSAAGAMQLQSSGTLEGLHLGWLDALLAATGSAPLAEAGLYTDLVLRGEWDVHMTDRLDIRAQLGRDSGDLWLGQPGAQRPSGVPVAEGTAQQDAAQAMARARREGLAAQIRTLELTVQSGDDDVAVALDWNTGRAGVIEATVRTGLTHQGAGWHVADDAPVSGSIQARMQDLGIWGFLAPPGWRVQGELNADITLGGTVQAPRAEGSIEASGLRIRSVIDGVDLHDGVLRATLQGQRLEIVELVLQGGTGSRAHVRGPSGNRTSPPTARGQMTASGTIDWSRAGDAGVDGSGIAMDVRATVERMQVLVRNDRQLSLDGELSAGLADGRLRVRGDLTVVRAAIMLPDARAPTLGDDVVVYSGQQEPPIARGRLQTANPMDLELTLDMGRDLALQGHGITTRLEGQLTVSSAPGGSSDPFRIVGEVRTDEGRFRAWGQALDVESGSVLFNGPYANPSLNLLAIRPEIEVRAGVRVTGTLSAPRLTLFSDPEMSEAEKLSWVVLGRDTAMSGSQGASMQQAALSLLVGGVGSSIAGDLGLDELALGESSVSIGKRISNELYITYEAGFAGAASTLFIFYDITRRLTLRGQTSEASALDIIYTVSYD